MFQQVMHLTPVEMSSTSILELEFTRCFCKFHYMHILKFFRLLKNFVNLPFSFSALQFIFKIGIIKLISLAWLLREIVKLSDTTVRYLGHERTQDRSCTG